ncbi:VanZ family protein [Actinosynnema mirum]|uniref:VanZ family protein n=1 Tax=Actinosynnema mirum (strain ATCC 29888 / DSM 43827 / JCM 3225 / NBRC 14064 / NCIMB 13271 / NRRL B-12336 / IMRU 3971 / 101) TaxID=446462 RepID=C6W8N2_ACTMD|nr:VanZ family protein [Actinosynnema mirum]ACU37131.1 VanZ family protein [Actinosynnema mirum DSM 43827]
MGDVMGSLGGLVDSALYLLRTPSMAVGIVVGPVLLAAIGWWVARRWGWRRAPGALAGLGVGLVLGVTLSRQVPEWASIYSGSEHAEFCTVRGFSFDLGNEMLNVLLFAPAAFFAVLATGAAWQVLGAAIGLSAVIELVQPLTERGICETQDLLNNSLGAAIAVGLGALVLAGERAARRSGAPV